jgi:hypothetical protein
MLFLKFDVVLRKSLQNFVVNVRRPLHNVLEPLDSVSFGVDAHELNGSAEV